MGVRTCLGTLFKDCTRTVRHVTERILIHCFLSHMASYDSTKNRPPTAWRGERHLAGRTRKYEATGCAAVTGASLYSIRCLSHLRDQTKGGTGDWRLGKRGFLIYVGKNLRWAAFSFRLASKSDI